MKTDKDNILYISLHSKEIFHRLRWSEGVVCPCCGAHNVYKYKDGTYKCAACHKRFSDTSNTIFHATKIPIAYWLIALYLVTMGKGISSEELARYLGVTQKTAWYLLHKIRYAFNDDGTVLEGDVAVDEVYLGGKWSSIIVPKKIEILKRYGLYYECDSRRTWHKTNIQRAISEYKQPVYGMNDGKHIVLRALPNTFNYKDILKITQKHVNDRLRHIVSDQSLLYSKMGQSGLDVIQMNHSNHEYKKDGYSSNRIEGTFSHLKTRYRYNYVHQTKKYIQLYLNEFCFRWNNRDKQSMDRLQSAMTLCVTAGKISRTQIDTYDWTKQFEPRKKKKHDSIEDLMRDGWLSCIRSVTIDGVTYTKQDYEAIKALRQELGG